MNYDGNQVLSQQLFNDLIERYAELRTLKCPFTTDILVSLYRYFK